MCGAPSFNRLPITDPSHLVWSLYVTRVARHRTRDRSQHGSYTPYISGVAQSPVYSTIARSDVCDDYIGRPVVASPLKSDSSLGPGLSLSGRATSTTAGGTISDLFNKYPYNPSASGLSTDTLAAPDGWYLDVVAGTNPSRPVVTPPTLLQDLIDIPGQLRSLGKLIRKPKSLMSSREIANHYLCVQFGWLPLIDDLRQLLNLQKYAIKRADEIHKLYSGKGLHRRIKFAEDHQNGVGVYSYPSYGPSNYVDASYDITVDRRSWATITWRPTTPPPFDLNDARLNSQCLRLVSGLTVEGLAKGLWDVIPWTWLLGWFSNVGKYTLAFSNTVPASHTEACFMSESKRTYTAKGVSYRNTFGNVRNEGVYVRTTKTRIVSGALTPGFNVPFLDTFRLSILGALFTQRTMR